MKNLRHLLFLVLCVGCAVKNNEETIAPAVTEKKVVAPQQSSKTYTLREMGITMEGPAGTEYLNWSTDRFTLLAHPLAKSPGTDAGYGVAIEGSRIPRDKVANSIIGKDESKEMQDWLNRFHPKTGTNSEQGFTYVRKDILMGNGDILCMRATIDSSPKQKQDVAFAKRVMASVKLLKDDLKKE